MTDAKRFPLLTEHGRRLLQRLREHPHAPRYTAQCGNRLTADYLRRVRAFEAELAAAPKGWPPGTAPAWLDDFVEMCFRDVPFYRRYGARPRALSGGPRTRAVVEGFLDIPAMDRSDLSREPWSFVPDSLPLEDLIVNSTSGTTGHPLTIISHPVVGACYTPLLKVALAMRGITLQSGAGKVGCVLVGLQQKAYTYPSVTPHQDDAGHIKLNLHPDDWRDPDDRVRFLDDCDPEIYTGDPFAFAELMRLPLKTRPRALVSTAMSLLPGLRRELEAHFGCPVIDLYSMNETGPIAVSDDEGFVILQHRLYVEILDAEGAPCPPGLRGEVTLTGGFNPFLPLLRYRTNDYASLEWRGGQPILVGLEGRPPVLFRGTRGQSISPLDVSKALAPFALPQFTLHQSADGALQMKVRRAGIDLVPLHTALLTLFGTDQAVAIEEAASLGDKVIQYTTAIPTVSEKSFPKL
jgi:phenylacetate-CoA ligase